MALDRVNPDDLNEVMCGLLAYISEGDKAAGAKMSYGDFGKHLAQEYGRNYHGCNGPNGCFISGTPTKVEIETSEGTKYELTWNKIAKFIHPYLKSTAVSETAETDTPTDTAAFDYSSVDDDTAQYLRKATARIANSYADIGAVLAEAQERLANNKNGIFQKWCVSLGISRATTYRLIDIHKFRSQMIISSQIGTISGNELEIFDNLPKTLQADISSPSAPAEAVNAVLSGDITTHKDYIALKKRIDELTEELDKADDWNEELTEERDKLKKDLERSESDARIVSTNYDKLREDYEELGDKNTALELELKKARSEAREVIMTDPKESQEYKIILDERNKMHRQIVATTQENDRLKDKQKELLQRYNELYEQARAAENDGRELTGYFLPVSVEEYSDICKQLKGTKYAELLYKAKLIKF